MNRSFSPKAAVLVCAAAFVSACASSTPPPKSATAEEKPDKVVRYNGASVEGRLDEMLRVVPPVPLEDAAERERQVKKLALQASPCDLQVREVPHGISISFFARDGANLSPEEIQEQVELIARVHNALHRVPEIPEQIPETAAVRFQPQRPDHSPLRAMMAIPSRATWESTARGARLVLTTADPADLVDLRAHVRWHAPELLPDVMSEAKRCPDVPQDLRAHYGAD